LFLSPNPVGKSAAQFSVGVLYHEGIGTKQSIISALEYYNLAAQQENADAYYCLGTSLLFKLFSFQIFSCFLSGFF
jgi:hypothetical protein